MFECPAVQGRRHASGRASTPVARRYSLSSTRVVGRRFTLQAFWAERTPLQSPVERSANIVRLDLSTMYVEAEIERVSPLYRGVLGVYLMNWGISFNSELGLFRRSRPHTSRLTSFASLLSLRHRLQRSPQLGSFRTVRRPVRRRSAVCSNSRCRSIDYSRRTRCTTLSSVSTILPTRSRSYRCTGRAFACV